MEAKIKRVYEPAAPEDGVRVLVDRLWPRGLKKAQAEVELWLKDVAPSDELRRWFGHDPQRWDEFRSRYFQELEDRPDAQELRRRLAAGERLTLLYAARDQAHNNAVALAEWLRA